MNGDVGTPSEGRRMPDCARPRIPWLKATRLRRRAVALVLVGMLLVGGCGDDDEAAGQDETTSTTSESRSTTSTTQPPGTDPASVEPIVRDLLARDDEITAQIVRDPSVVLDPDAPILAELAEVQAPGEAYEARLRTYRENAERGLKIEALNGKPGSKTELVGELSTVEQNTVEGQLCILYNYRAEDAAGYVEVKDGLAHPGRVTAVRLDGVWKIQQIDIDDGQVCNPEATA
jgi:hypothetical protein